MNIDSWLVDTITVASRTGRDAAGDPSFGAQSEVRCRVENKRELIERQDGTQQEVDFSIATTTEIQVGDRVWLPGANPGNDSEAKQAVLVKSATIKDGTFRLYELRV